MDSADAIFNIIDKFNDLLNDLPSDLPLEIVDEEGNEACLNLQSLKYEPNENLVRVWCNTTEI